MELTEDQKERTFFFLLSIQSRGGGASGQKIRTPLSIVHTHTVVSSRLDDNKMKFRCLRLGMIFQGVAVEWFDVEVISFGEQMR